MLLIIITYIVIRDKKQLLGHESVMKLVPNIYDVPEVKAEKHWSFVSYKPD
jgi:hypothetical protein